EGRARDRHAGRTDRGAGRRPGTGRGLRRPHAGPAAQLHVRAEPGQAVGHPRGADREAPPEDHRRQGRDGTVGRPEAADAESRSAGNIPAAARLGLRRQRSEADVIQTLLHQWAASTGRAPDWLLSLAAMIVALAIAWGLHRLAYAMLDRLARKRGLLPHALLARTAGPTRLASMILALGVAASVSPLPDSYRPWIRHLLQIGFIGLLGWLALGILHVLTVVYSRRFETDQAQTIDARRHLT